MNRTTWLQDRRMQKFRDVLGRWERRPLERGIGFQNCTPMVASRVVV
jgi:hypothetical protein